MAEIEALLPCFKCGKRLRNAMGADPDNNQPAGGTAFISPGHYGSTFFDPIDGSTLEITICDDCLANNEAAIGWRRPAPPSARPALVAYADSPQARGEGSLEPVSSAGPRHPPGPGSE